MCLVFNAYLCQLVYGNVSNLCAQGVSRRHCTVLSSSHCACMPGQANSSRSVLAGKEGVVGLSRWACQPGQACADGNDQDHAFRLLLAKFSRSRPAGRSAASGNGSQSNRNTQYTLRWVSHGLLDALDLVAVPLPNLGGVDACLGFTLSKPQSCTQGSGLRRDSNRHGTLLFLARLRLTPVFSPRVWTSRDL